MEAGSGQGAGQRGSPMMAASTSSAMEDTKLKPLPPSNGPRPHRCEVCQRSFREVATLRKHEQLHRADRPYVCNTCGKSFLWSSNLKVHERVHTGERPYKCKICHRCFTQSNDLRRHERNVHMRGKIYGYKSSGRHSSQPGSQQVNLAAYQAFAMQQRALLQQALTYESYLQKAAAGSGQSAAQLYHHTQGMGGAGTASMVGQRPPDPASSPRSPLKLEQVTPPSTPSDLEGHEKRAQPHGSPHDREALHSPVRAAGAHASMPLVSAGAIQPPAPLLPSHYPQIVKSDGLELPHSRAGTLPSFSSFRPMQRPMEGLSSLPLGSRHHLPSGHRAQPHLGEGQSLPHPNLRLTQEMINFHHQHLNNNNSSSTNHNNGESRHTPPQPTSQGMTDGRDKDIDPQGRRSRERDDYRRLSRGEEESREYDRESDREIDVPSRREEGSGRGYGREGSIELKREASEGQTSPCDYHQPVHKHRLREILESQSAAPAHTIEDDHRKVPSSYPCDSVMDLSMNKSSHSPPSRASSAASSTVDKEVSAVAAMPPPKTPTSVGAESESEPGKRDVTTTSATPTADSGGIHHCQHCNIFFYDYTMFHLHESLHMPYEDHPFRCPSCGTHCQDKIEFMFHTVWHVKYPHTIPNYTPFREGFLSSP